MELRVRITTVEQQDILRREDMRKMNSEQRISALIEMRDRQYPYEPLVRIVSVRKLP